MKMKMTTPKNKDDLTQKIKTTSIKKWRRLHPKEEDDLTQKIKTT